MKDKSVDRSALSSKSIKKQPENETSFLGYNKNEGSMILDKKLSRKDSKVMNNSVLNQDNSFDLVKQSSSKQIKAPASIFRIVRELKNISDELKKLIAGYSSMFEVMYNKFRRDLVQLTDKANQFVKPPLPGKVRSPKNISNRLKIVEK